MAGLGVTLLGCGYSEEEMQAKIDRIEELEGQLRDAQAESEARQTQIQALQTQNSELGDRLRALGEEVEGLESERGNLQSSLAETQRALGQLRARERQQAERLAVFRQMLARFRSMIAAGRLRVRIVRNRMVIELSDTILFDAGRASLKHEGRDALAQIVGVLNSIEDREFQVAGHTDNIPMRSSRFASNWELSATRAVNSATVSELLRAFSIMSCRRLPRRFSERARAAVSATPVTGRSEGSAPVAMPSAKPTICDSGLTNHRCSRASVASRASKATTATSASNVARRRSRRAFTSPSTLLAS